MLSTFKDKASECTVFKWTVLQAKLTSMLNDIIWREIFGLYMSLSGSYFSSFQAKLTQNMSATFKAKSIELV